MPITAEALEAPIPSERAQLDDDNPFTLAFRVMLCCENHPMPFMTVVETTGASAAITEAIGRFEFTNQPIKGWLCVSAHQASRAIFPEARS